MFKLESAYYEKGDTVLSTEKNNDKLMIVAEGLIEVVTSFESNEFIIDKFGRGSVLNYRNFFKQDPIQVTYRCAKDCQVFTLDLASMRDIIHDHYKKDNGKDIDRVQNKINKDKDKQFIEGSSKLKNTIMNVVVKNREIK